MIETILIVDDDPIMVSAVDEILHFNKVRSILKAYDLSQAQRICKSIILDLIICDYHLPEGNGLEIYQWLTGKNIKTPFILFTGRQFVQNLPSPDTDLFYPIYNKDFYQLNQTVCKLCN